MLRSSLTLLVVVATVLGAVPAYATTIPEREIEDFSPPCSLDVDEFGSVRTLTWAAVAGASSYKVGYRTGSTIVGLAELSGTSYDHVGWDPNACLEYVVVAYDSGGAKVCAAHVPSVGACVQ